MGQTFRPDQRHILLPAPPYSRAACCLLGLALLLLLTAGVLTQPAHAQPSRDVPGQTDRWDEPDPPEELDDGAEPDPGDGDDGADDDPIDADDPADINRPKGGGALDDKLDVLPDPPATLDGLQDELPLVTSTFVSGTRARLRTDGRAAIPIGAPGRVRRLLSELNRIVGKRYKRGGGHAKLVDKGYDSSGAVSYGLIKTGLLQSSMVSGRFARWGDFGEGRWVTIYANRGHVYMEVAGLRLDTSTVADSTARRGVHWRPVIGRRDGFMVRHPDGL